ncbi:MAG: GGDEF domain-containing protein [Agarilytica sp.]
MVRLASSRPDSNAKPNNLASVSHLADEKYFKELRFNLAYNLLQTSLDLEVTLQQFFEKLQDFVQTSGLTYTYEPSGVEVSLGKTCPHTAAYNIATDDAKLGKVTFSRNKRFGETELAVLEMMIGVLLFPLRNALQYREALESSMRDNLTEIGNRNALEANFGREIKLAKRHHQPLSILMIDVDHFKRVNDSVGHINGDKTLKQIVSSIQDTLRETDQVFRYGGEEFVALLHNTGSHEAEVIAERIRVNVAMSPVSLNDKDLFCTVSIGISSFKGTEDCKELIEIADTALYKAKNKGRNRVEK